MNLFEEQIRTRKDASQAAMEDSFQKMTGAIMGQRISDALFEDRIGADDAIARILKFYHIKNRELPESFSEESDIDEILEYKMRSSGVMRRNVSLKPKWYQDAAGAMLGAAKEDGRVIALIPNSFSGYYFIDRDTGKKVRVNRKTAETIQPEAIAFYKPFPLTKLTIGSLLKYIIQMIALGDILMLIASMLVVTAVGLLVPKLNNLLFSDVIASGSVRILVGIGIYLVCVSISRLLFNTVQTLMSAKITSRLSFAVEAATMMRILSLPPGFFRNYSAGELSSRASHMSNLCDGMVNLFFNTLLSALLTLIYLTQIDQFASSLVTPSLIITLATLAVSVIQVILQVGVSRKAMLAGSKESGLSYQLISGIQKIKLAGAEERAFAKWGVSFANTAQHLYSPPFFLKISSVITLIISLVGTIVMYAIALRSGVAISEYYAFSAAYGMVNSAFLSLAAVAAGIAGIKPTLDMAKPIMEYESELAEEREVIKELKGKIELHHVTFQYSGNDQRVLDDLSLSIRPGQYVAVVGETGCGKSTLMRVMLGFETPQRGSVYYDGKDIEDIDLRSLRRRIGTVMQNGKLFSGDIFSNITISAPNLTMQDAWEAAEIAGIADDIRRMPMGMFTMLSEGQGGISGGQRQRILIARAVAPKPGVLMFDEATSALDNITQKHISDALDRMNCTRIVIAHRLSTIRQCDRILMLDQGKIVEDGTYEELIAKNGRFAEMVKRQQVE